MLSSSVPDMLQYKKQPVEPIEHKPELLQLFCFSSTVAIPDAGQNDLRRAARFWACAEATRDSSGYGWSVAFSERFGRWTAQARQRLGAPDWTLAWAAGRAMPLQDVVAELLAEAADRLATPI